ncbi:hypothetical protein E4U32_007591 [Claviceps aff. humidiphila group G2b]|nr:hypothetical protein E4U32_007591 [Claviceps aff. humidiphila group G2b]
MSNKRTDISSFRKLIQDLICKDCRQQEILSIVNTQLVAQNQRAIGLRALQGFIAESLSSRKPNLDGVRELVQTLIHDGSRQSDILRIVNEQLSANNQHSIGLSTLQQNIRDWGFNQRARQTDINSLRELVQTLIHQGSRQSDILRIVNEQLSANNQHSIGLSTLKRNIRDWGFNQRARQTDTNSLRELVQTRLDNGDTTREILEHVNTQRRAQNECAITVRTLQQRLKDWGLDRKTQHARILRESGEEISELLVQEVPLATIRRSMNEAIEEQGLPPISEYTLSAHVKSLGFQPQERVRITEELVDCVRSRFFAYGISDTSLLRDIQECDNLPCSPHIIRKIRYQYGMKRRCRTEEERVSILQRGLEFMELDLRRSNAILNFGRQLLSHYVRQQGQVLVPRNPLYNIYRQLHPEEVQRRSPGNFKYRGNFRVSGPNFFWCLDGYEKLSQFGFQVYACIDAYSRCIIWLYCGRSATTALSTLKQYLRTVKTLGMRPLLTRTDRGRETPLFVMAQAMLAAANPITVTYEDVNGNERTFTQGNRMSSCHHYGPSTQNVRIESWWGLLRKGAAQDWICFFSLLVGNREFQKGNLVDEIAMYAVYGSEVRRDLANFVTLSNGRTIRKQRNREHVVSGIPADLYRTQSARNWGVHIDEDENAADRMALNRLLDPLESVDIDRFLAQETENWCDSRLQEMGFFEAPARDRDEPYRNFYLGLRRQIKAHQDSGAEPILRLSPIPLGGCSEYMRLFEQTDGHREDSNLQDSSIPPEFLEHDDSEFLEDNISN